MSKSGLLGCCVAQSLIDLRIFFLTSAWVLWWRGQHDTAQ